MIILINKYQLTVKLSRVLRSVLHETNANGGLCEI